MQVIPEDGRCDSAAAEFGVELSKIRRLISFVRQTIRGRPRRLLRAEPNLRDPHGLTNQVLIRVDLSLNRREKRDDASGVEA